MLGTRATTEARRRHKALAAACIAVLTVVAGCGTSAPGSSTSMSPTPEAAPPRHSLPAATIATATPTLSPLPSLEIATPPATQPPLAGSFPIVNSCDPASVPGAIPVAAPASPRASSFTLYVPILMYHRIVPRAEAGNSLAGLVVAPETFDAQLTALVRAGWHTITTARLADDLQAHITPPAKTVAITIDDGWNDGYNYAFPILQSHGYVATFFVVAGRIDKPDFLSSGQLGKLLAAGDEIGDHTMDHLSLTAQGADGLKYQIDAGASRIAQVTGRWPESLAYPSGRENSRVVAAVAACQELRIAVLDGHLTVQAPGATQEAGANPAPPPTVNIQGQESWAERFLAPRVRVAPGTSPAALLGLLGYR